MNKPSTSGFLGNMNAYIETPIVFKRKRLVFDGTTVNLVNVLVAAGAQVGDTFVDDQDRKRKVIAAPGDTRTNGFWVTAFNEKN
jgi:hypothetical protein